MFSISQEGKLKYDFGTTIQKINVTGGKKNSNNLFEHYRNWTGSESSNGTNGADVFVRLNSYKEITW